MLPAIWSEVSPPPPNPWLSADVFPLRAAAPVHLVLSSLSRIILPKTGSCCFCAGWEQHAELGWFINISPGALPYYAIRVIAKLTRLHPFVHTRRSR